MGTISRVGNVVIFIKNKSVHTLWPSNSALPIHCLDIHIYTHLNSWFHTVCGDIDWLSLSYPVGTETWGNWCENMLILWLLLLIWIIKFLSLTQQSHAFCQHPQNWQANQVACKYGKTSDNSQFLTDQ